MLHMMVMLILMNVKLIYYLEIPFPFIHLITESQFSFHHSSSHLEGNPKGAGTENNQKQLFLCSKSDHCLNTLILPIHY